jgi:cysteine desulfurase
MAANNEIGTSSRWPRSARSPASTAPCSTPTRPRRREDPARRPRDAHRSAVADRAQVLRPEGCGALYVRRRSRGSRWRRRWPAAARRGAFRSGTLNVPGIVGLGQAAEICRLEMADEGRRLGAAARSSARGTAGVGAGRARERLARAPACRTTSTSASTASRGKRC